MKKSLSCNDCRCVGKTIWNLTDVYGDKVERLPLIAFNHISREVLSLDNSRRFYCDILGFEVNKKLIHKKLLGFIFSINVLTGNCKTSIRVRRILAEWIWCQVCILFVLLKLY
jgi:hypothetical protein